jgi:hypothetical protein
MAKWVAETRRSSLCVSTNLYMPEYFFGNIMVYIWIMHGSSIVRNNENVVQSAWRIAALKDFVRIPDDDSARVETCSHIKWFF